MRDLADGKTNDLQKVVTSVEEANLALHFTMAMRSKLLDAYHRNLPHAGLAAAASR